MGRRSAVVALLVGLLLGSQLGSSATASAGLPAATFTPVRYAITAGWHPEISYRTVNLPASAFVALQRQFGTAHVWQRVKVLNPRPGTHINYGPPVEAGLYAYRIRVSLYGRTITTSPVHHVWSYGTISLAAMCAAIDGGGCQPGYEQVGSTVFNYVMAISSGSGFQQAAAMSRTSCRSMTLQFASSNPDNQASDLQVLQSASDPEYGSTPVDVIGSHTFALDGGSWILNAKTTLYSSEIYLNGAASCYTAEGSR